MDTLDDNFLEEDYCPGSMNNKHKVDFSSVNITSDGGEWYVDVNCAHCGRSGCLGTVSTLSEGVSW